MLLDDIGFVAGLPFPVLTAAAIAAIADAGGLDETWSNTNEYALPVAASAKSPCPPSEANGISILLLTRCIETNSSSKTSPLVRIFPRVSP